MPQGCVYLKAPPSMALFQDSHSPAGHVTFCLVLHIMCRENTTATTVLSGNAAMGWLLEQMRTDFLLMLTVKLKLFQ